MAFQGARRLRDPDWLHESDGTWASGIRAVTALEEIKDQERSFELRWEADMRAIKRWQAAEPSRELRWTDHADLVVWLLSVWMHAPAARRGGRAHQPADSDLFRPGIPT
ncbi:hypothetical protein ABIF68_000916 [Bradyrhizobium japonicum]|uniref:hypothetical protein n=1 Tax=Bradyrhizobium japonicum TaxID=375 RepID=UPI0004B023B0|nr:hypothetical protein [Bradyrhizobium japonicum]